MNAATTNATELRKAAVLLRSLDPEAAAALLSGLSPDEARAVRAAVREVREFDEDEQLSVFEELRDRSTGPADPPPQDSAGVEVQFTRAGLTQSAAPAIEMPRTVPSQTGGDNPFASFPELDEADPATLAGYLKRENAAVVAVVLSYLSPDHAGAVLDELPFGLRVEAMDRLAGLGDSDTESLRVVATGLSAWIKQQQSEQRRRQSRLAAIEAILGSASKSSRDDLVDELSQRGREWAASLAATVTEPAAEEMAEPIAPEAMQETPSIDNGEQGEQVATPSEEPGLVEAFIESPPAPPRPLSVPFLAFEKLDTSLLAQVMKRTPPRQLLLALAGATEGLQRRIESLLPSRQVKQLRRRIDAVGPTTLRDIDDAQNAMAQVASELWDFYYGSRTT
ncbi:MAG: FliG C-terminal domain-containing protein [Planctomycetota bacterium]